VLSVRLWGGLLYARTQQLLRTGKHMSMFASAEYADMIDSSDTVAGRAGLRYGF
jgi:hypothetical protein